jgi:hypothetical protein
MPIPVPGLIAQAELSAEEERMVEELLARIFAPLAEGFMEMVIPYLLFALLMIAFFIGTLGSSLLTHRGGDYPENDQ